MYLYSKADNITTCIKIITNFMQGPFYLRKQAFLNLQMKSSIFVSLY